MNNTRVIYKNGKFEKIKVLNLGIQLCRKKQPISGMLLTNGSGPNMVI